MLPGPSMEPIILKLHETYLIFYLKFLQFLISKIFFYYIKCEHFKML